MNKKLTVFTPTYNRAHLLPRLYNSLCRQTSMNFCWLVVDDGSTDNTAELIESWQQEASIDIRYFYKENGGMHTGHNLAYSKVETELNVCIDSDDYMPDRAVEMILEKWQNVEDKTKIAGIIGLDADENGKLIGTGIPADLRQGYINDLYMKHGVKGDKKLIIRTDVVRQYPAYPEYKGEKLVPLGILYMMIGKDYDFIYSNEIYCIVEYQAEGSSHTIFKQYAQSSRGFAYARKIKLKYSKNFTEIIKNCIHLGSLGITTKNLTLILHNNPYKLFTLLLLPAGALLNIFVRFKNAFK
jgi:glycosyltransferase involved in cell wall biosynthesis